MKKVAISACLLGRTCRYDGGHNRLDERLLKELESVELLPFCPEEDAFGSPRPTMDLVATSEGIRAISNATGEDLSLPIYAYAEAFFDAHSDISLYIGKDRSPSCGVCSARVYDKRRKLLCSSEAGLMTKEAQKRNIPCIDAEDFKGIQ